MGSTSRSWQPSSLPSRPEEDAFIEALRIQGYTYQKIADVAAKRFGHQRSAATVGIRLKMLASREAS